MAFVTGCSDHKTADFIKQIISVWYCTSYDKYLKLQFKVKII